MQVAEILSILAMVRQAELAAAQIRDFLIRQASLGGNSGEFTPEQLAQIKAAAGVSDENWDAAVQAARARIGGV